MLRYLNGGESHGKGLIAILEGMPSGVPLTADDINRDLARRQKGYGRGGRMRIEQDRVEFLSGVRKGFTLGRSEEHTSELQSQSNLVCRLLLEKKKDIKSMLLDLGLFSCH